MPFSAGAREPFSNNCRVPAPAPNLHHLHVLATPCWACTRHARVFDPWRSREPWPPPLLIRKPISIKKEMPVGEGWWHQASSTLAGNGTGVGSSGRAHAGHGVPRDMRPPARLGPAPKALAAPARGKKALLGARHMLMMSTGRRPTNRCPLRCRLCSVRAALLMRRRAASRRSRPAGGEDPSHVEPCHAMPCHASKDTLGLGDSRRRWGGCAGIKQGEGAIIENGLVGQSPWPFAREPTQRNPPLHPIPCHAMPGAMPWPWDPFFPSLHQAHGSFSLACRLSWGSFPCRPGLPRTTQSLRTRTLVDLLGVHPRIHYACAPETPECPAQVSCTCFVSVLFLAPCSYQAATPPLIGPRFGVCLEGVRVALAVGIIVPAPLLICSHKRQAAPLSLRSGSLPWLEAAAGGWRHVAHCFVSQDRRR